jgi:hypothetical protein
MPVLVVGRFLDGAWDFLCGAESHDDDELLIAHAYHLVEDDRTLEAVADLPSGYSTERASAGELWSTYRVEPAYKNRFGIR